MSMKLMALAMSVKVGNPVRKLVLIKLADNANDKGECFPSYQHISDQCEISRRAVMQHIKALRDMGFLWVESRKNGNVNKSNVYHLTILKGGECGSLGGSEQGSLGGECGSLGGSEQGSPITYHSFEPVIEPSLVDAVAPTCETSEIDNSKPVRQKKRLEAPIAEIVAAYNEVTKGVLPSVQQITESRRKAVNARWLQFKNTTTPDGNIRYSDDESGVIWWKKFFGKVLMNERWVGGSGIEWTADFDWIVKQANFVKILEWRPAQRGDRNAA